MAMNFWEAQRKARSRTKVYIFLFILMTLVVAGLSELALRYFMGEQYEPPLPIFGAIFVALTFVVAYFNYYMYSSHGGSYVAESCGGRLINPDTTDAKERQLINIVEEIAIAAALPVPLIYIIPSQSINAFAAGTTHENAAIAVTEGSLAKLNRDELQGVIAHEFGHVYNGDMVVSMRLAAMTMGFFFILYIGLRILQFSSLSGGRRNGKKEGNVTLYAALIFIVAGALTWFFGSILKCCVSREKEYLADACAVQFTRNPSGISGALKKIGLETESKMPSEGQAFTHMYLDNHSGFSSLFATHPPLEKRIEAIEGETYKPDTDLTKVPPPSE